MLVEVRVSCRFEVKYSVELLLFECFDSIFALRGFIKQVLCVSALSRRFIGGFLVRA